MRLGIDVGGTFTDFAYMSDDGEIRFSKVLTTYPPETGIQEGLRELNVNLANFSFISHSTTLGLNALVTGRGAKTALITTKGFRDVLEIGRTRRLNLYDLFQDKPEPQLIPRSLRFVIEERLDKFGNVIKPIDEQAVRVLANKIRETDVEALAVCLLHSYSNPNHERIVQKVFAEECPNVFLSISSDVLPEYREYERMFATSLNAYIGPIMLHYFQITDRIFAGAGYKGESFISQSNGGLMSTKVAASRPVYALGFGISNGPVYTIGSGPASGVIGGVFIGQLAGFGDLVSMDMGGTTCLCSLVHAGVPSIISETTLGNRLKLPMVDVRSIGAGGGSIAWIDPQGALHVGPESAAANPGPACYGFGGRAPTVTDANLFLGLLDANFYLGGRMKVYPDKSKDVLTDLADRLGAESIEIAYGITKIVESNMVNNISEVSVWRGHDPRELALLASGGGSGLHCVRMAAELEIRTVISPPYPAIVSALGHIVSDVKHFYSRTFLRELGSDFSQVNNFYCESETAALNTIRSELPDGGNTHLFRSADMRYAGQTHEITVELPNKELNAQDREELSERFHMKHKETYGYSLPTYSIELVTLRLEAIGSSPSSIKIKRKEKVRKEPSRDSIRSTKEVYLSESRGFSMVKSYDRQRLKPGNIIQGPALIEGVEANVLIPESWSGEVDEYENLLITMS
jgi:N-methylhydantoinase A